MVSDISLVLADLWSGVDRRNPSLREGAFEPDQFLDTSNIYGTDGRDVLGSAQGSRATSTSWHQIFFPMTNDDFGLSPSRSKSSWTRP